MRHDPSAGGGPDAVPAQRVLGESDLNVLGIAYLADRLLGLGLGASPSAVLVLGPRSGDWSRVGAAAGVSMP